MSAAGRAPNPSEVTPMSNPYSPQAAAEQARDAFRKTAALTTKIAADAAEPIKAQVTRSMDTIRKAT